MISKLKDIIVLFLELSFKKKAAVTLMYIMGVFSLATFINSQLVNNMAWLQGNWENGEVDYSLKVKDKQFRTWVVKKDGDTVLENATVSAASKKKYIILTDDFNTVEYHIIKINRHSIELKLKKDSFGEHSEILRKQ